jgi:hypothetical protein
MNSDDSKIENIQTDFQTLTKSASSLNIASDELTKAVALLDIAIKNLNVGLTVWVSFTTWESDQPSEYDDEQIGYCKVNGKWGISLRRIWGDNIADNHSEDGPWLFSDGPREMRLKGVEKIAELIKELNEQASETTKQVRKKTEHVREVARVLASIAKEKELTKKSTDLESAIEKTRSQTMMLKHADELTSDINKAASEAKSSGYSFSATETDVAKLFTEKGPFGIADILAKKPVGGK